MHLSEFDLLAPADQPQQQQRQREEVGVNELEYEDVHMEPIPRQPITPQNQPPPPPPGLLQRWRANYDRRPSRGLPPPRRIALPALLSQAQEPPPPQPQPYVYNHNHAAQQQQQQQQQAQAEYIRHFHVRWQTKAIESTALLFLIAQNEIGLFGGAGVGTEQSWTKDWVLLLVNTR